MSRPLLDRSSPRHALIHLFSALGIAIRRAFDRGTTARPKTAFPTIEDLARMGPERATAWHQEAGIEARVSAAIAETEGQERQT